MKSLFTLVLISSSILTASCQTPSKMFPEQFSFDVQNPVAKPRANTLVVLSPEKIKSKAPAFNTAAFAVFVGDTEIASQYNSKEIHDRGLAFVIAQLKGNETIRVTVRYAKKGSIVRHYEKKTQAELSHKEGGKWVNREYIGGQFKNVQYLRVPPEHKDHSWFIRYEGPGWESDVVGYRFYLDQRNAIDVFGKKVSEPVLQNVGKDGFDSYHELHSWGMDVMKVGKSLGIGSIGYFKTGSAIRVEKTDSVSCTILENGPVQSSFVTRYHGWDIGDQKCSLESGISIHAGTRLTTQRIRITGEVNELATGIVKDTLAKLLIRRGDKKSFGYIATYGKQSLNNDNLGLVVFFDPADLISITEDQQSHIVVLRANNRVVKYSFAAAWEGEVGAALKTESAFTHFLEETAHELASPVLLKF